MSYCRFENTAKDMRECKIALQEGKELKGSELIALKWMVKLAQDIIDSSEDYNLEGITE